MTRNPRLGAQRVRTTPAVRFILRSLEAEFGQLALIHMHEFAGRASVGWTPAKALAPTYPMAVLGWVGSSPYLVRRRELAYVKDQWLMLDSRMDPAPDTAPITSLYAGFQLVSTYRPMSESELDLLAAQRDLEAMQFQDRLFHNLLGSV